MASFELEVTGMKDKWTVGPQFNPYMAMNFKWMLPYYVFILLIRLIGMGNTGYLLMIPALTKLYSQTLYHKQAYLYQSVPVSSFETVLVKTLVGAIGFLTPDVGAQIFNFIACAVKGYKFYLYEQVKYSGLMLHAEAGVVLYYLNIMALAFLICGIALFGVAVGNRARGDREKKPNAVTVVLVIAGMFLVLYGLFWIMDQIQFRSALLRGILQLAGSTIGAGCLFWLNVRALDKWYSI